MGKIIDLTDQKFGRLTVIEFTEIRNKRMFWKCQCDCGEYVVVSGANIRSRHTSSCGCFREEIRGRASITHGMRYTSTYRSWASMKNRCTNPKNDHYADYGGRGIMICNEWFNFESFLFDMGIRPLGTTIDRINANGNYCKDNCRWSTQEKQCNNKRNNYYIVYNGQKKTIPEWSRELDISIMTIRNRILVLKWPIEKALSN